MTEPFGGERFTYSLFLVLCNRLTTCCVAASILLVCQNLYHRPVAPSFPYCAGTYCPHTIGVCNPHAIQRLLRREHVLACNALHRRRDTVCATCICLRLPYSCHSSGLRTGLINGGLHIPLLGSALRPPPHADCYALPLRQRDRTCGLWLRSLHTPPSPCPTWWQPRASTRPSSTSTSPCRPSPSVGR